MKANKKTPGTAHPHLERETSVACRVQGTYLVSSQRDNLVVSQLWWSAFGAPLMWPKVPHLKSRPSQAQREAGTSQPQPMAASGRSGLPRAWSGCPVGLSQWPGAWSGPSVALCPRFSLRVLLSRLCLWSEGLGMWAPSWMLCAQNTCCVLWSWAGRRVLVLVPVLIDTLFFKT